MYLKRRLLLSFLIASFSVHAMVPEGCGATAADGDCEMVDNIFPASAKFAALPYDTQRIIASNAMLLLTRAVLQEVEVPCRELVGHSQGVMAIAWSPDGSQLASGSVDATVRIWNPATGQLERKLVGHGHCVTAVAWSPDGSHLASGSWDQTVRIWNPTTSQLERKLVGHRGAISAVAWSPDGSKLASVSGDRTVRLWNPATGQLERELVGLADNMAVAWSPDGSQLASGSRDKTVRLWNSATGQLERQLVVHDGPVWAVAWSRDGSQLASGSGDNTVRICNSATGQLEHSVTAVTRRPIDVQNHGVTAVAWSPDGSQLSSGSKDQTVRLWNPATGQLERELVGYAGTVTAVAWSPDGSQLASGSYTGRLWNMRILHAVKKWLSGGCPSIKTPYTSESGEQKAIVAPPIALFALINKLLFSEQAVGEKNTGIPLSKTEIVLWGCLPKEIQKALIDTVAKKEGEQITYGESLLEDEDCAD